MSNSLEERLRSNTNVFEGLLALIPAKYYYDEKTQDQWKAKKKSKSQAKDDKQKKLDPEQMDDGTLSTLEIMKKRESNAKPVVLPGEKLKQLQQRELTVASSDDASVEDEADIKIIFDDEGNEVSVDKENKVVESTSLSEEEQVEDEEQKVGEKVQKLESKKPMENGQKKKNLEALRSKLQAKIQDLKERRKAPGSKVKGAPSSREAILAERKRKLETKKEKQPTVQQDDDDNISENSDSDLDSDSDNDNLDAAQSRKKRKIQEDDIASGVMFQNIVFDDGNRVTSNLQTLRKNTKKKGPSKNDIRSHLKLVEAKKTKLESKDELEQIKLKEKEKWQRAMLQAEGVKLKDDEKLLRKALKRKEAKKRKSSVDWKERQRAVTSTIAEKQKRREENLKIRKDNKGVKKSKQQKMKRKYTGTVAPKKSRAGFEGRLKSGQKK